MKDDSLWTGHPILRSRNYHRVSGKLDTAVYTLESLGEARLQVMPSYMSRACLAPILLSNGKFSGDKVS